MERQKMSESKKDISELNLSEQLKMQRALFVQQKEVAQNNLNQLVGAIYACELMIQKHEAEKANHQPAGDQGNGEADKQQKEQAA
jgi:hypothetical protein